MLYARVITPLWDKHQMARVQTDIITFCRGGIVNSFHLTESGKTSVRHQIKIELL